MLQRRFGRTELKMPVFSCGGMRYQHKWQDVPLAEVPPENQANLEATIRRSLELGINHIETAHSYGSSERQLGLVLPKLPRAEMIVQTKVEPQADSQKFKRLFYDSLDRLQLDYVDLLGIHGINNHELLWQTVRQGGCLSVARELQAEGLVRHVGFSTHAATEVMLDAIHHEADGGFDYINLHWYYIYQRNWPAVQAATERDMGVFIISPADKGGMLYKPPEKLVELCQPLHPLVFNCLFCLSRPEIHTLSLGASCPTDFDLQLTALPYLEKSDELLPPILARLRQAMLDAVGEDCADQFFDGLPTWENAPGYMNLPIMLWLRTLVEAYDMHDYARMRYNLLGNGSHWFPGLNAAPVAANHVAANHNGLDLSTALKDSPCKEKIPGWLSDLHTKLYEAPKKRLSQS